MATRKKNEKEYGNWIDLPDGTRRYWYDRQGKNGFQRMVKIVDIDENTLFVIQEIYNDNNQLMEIHQKFPIDTGHQTLS
jgi:hypothetical protein